MVQILWLIKIKTTYQLRKAILKLKNAWCPQYSLDSFMMIALYLIKLLIYFTFNSIICFVQDCLVHRITLTEVNF